MDENFTLLRNIKDILKSKNMTQETLAEKIGKSHSYVRSFASGHNPPSYSLVKEIAKALDVRIADLFKPEKEAAKPLNTASIFQTLADHSDLIELLAKVPSNDNVFFDSLKDEIVGHLKLREQERQANVNREA